MEKRRFSRSLVFMLTLCTILSSTPVLADTDASQPPALPSGAMTPPEGQLPEGTPPEGMGEPPEGTPPEGMELPAEGMGDDAGAPPGGFGGSQEPVHGQSAFTISEDSSIEGETYLSTGDDENALRIDAATVSLSGVTIQKTSGASSNTENGDFYGQNAGLLALNGAQVSITDMNVETSAQNGNGVFSYGSGTVVNIADSTITTTANNSGGIQTTGGGTTNASNLQIHTSGNSSAAIRSDRGGGIVNVTGGNYVTDGTGSPAVYSTAEISVSNATLTANHSEAVVVEGKNSVTLVDCDVTSSMDGTYNDGSENIHAVMIYQSMSGDADVGQSHFSMTGGSLTALTGDLFYITNTDCTIDLSGVDLTLANDTFLRLEGNQGERGWGKQGENGGTVDLTAIRQTIVGDIVVDTISTLNFTLQEESVYEGTLSIVENAAGGSPAQSNIHLVIEEGCTLTLTGDSQVTTLQNEGTLNLNGYTLTLADGTVLQ